MNYEEAKSIVYEKYLKPWSEKNGLELMIVDESTIEKDYGWIFFYTTKRFYYTKDTHYALAGNAPVLFNKHNQTSQTIGYLPSVEAHIDQYEREVLGRKLTWWVVADSELKKNEKLELINWAKERLELTSIEAFALVRANTSKLEFASFELADEVQRLLKSHRSDIKVIKEESNWP